MQISHDILWLGAELRVAHEALIALHLVLLTLLHLQSEVSFSCGSVRTNAIGGHSSVQANTVPATATNTASLRIGAARSCA